MHGKGLRFQGAREALQRLACRGHGEVPGAQGKLGEHGLTLDVGM